ncbi:MAG: hypothetical protein KJO07_09100 [Deltaproteobacteria bacterium]|nr:hypothetical protein [Deltaproteobacteria bacterium]
MLHRSLALVLTMPLALACSSQSAYDDDWGAGLVTGGKADGLADSAKPLDFDQLGTGEVNEDSIVLFKIELQRGDQIEVEKKVTSGDLAPHFTLHRGLLSTIHSQSFDVDPDRLHKTYLIETTGTHFFAARAFQNQGSGAFTLQVTCNGGPCAGQFNPEPLDGDEAADCIRDAFVCAQEDLKQFNGAVGPARATSSFEGCLAASGTPSGSSCAIACNGAGTLGDEILDDLQVVCNEMKFDLQFFADQNDACFAEYDNCMHECMDGPQDLPTCYSFGFNGTCPTYAKALDSCGGSVEVDGDLACHLLCESTFGAHNDDLDTICEEDCGVDRPDDDFF